MTDTDVNYKRAIEAAKKRHCLVTVTADLTFLIRADDPEKALKYAVESLHSDVGGVSITEGAYSWELRSARIRAEERRG